MKRKLRKLQESENIGLWHVSMSRDYAHCTSGPTLFEVTSPDWADRLANANPAMVPPKIPLHAVSAGVAGRLRDGLSDRNVIEAPLLFPNLDPESARKPEMDEKENLIVFAHRLVARKNGRLFARVVRRFLADHPDWRVAIRGKGPEESAVRKTLEREISEGRVALGYTPEIHAEMYRARIFVSIISPDNYPSQSVVEAMLAGNALLLSDMGQSREKFLDGNGMAAPIDEDHLLNCLDKMVSDQEGLNGMGARSLKLAAERFSHKEYLDHLRGVYRECGSDLD
jgi:glycosyltransferase involved in cell wall biosynthesis